MEDNINLAGLRPEFCSHSARVMSFKTKKTMPKGSRWPHPQSFPLTPEVLASAGYFHDPAANEPDRTTCWMCGESMKGWAEDDDPWTLHLKWSSNCSYARLALLEHERDTKNPSWSDSPNHSWGPANEWFPRGQLLIESRLATFCGPDGPWKHEGKKGIPTRLELARAGFHFTPNLFKKGRKFDVDDTTSCCYCHRSVTEWEVDDDPVSVHLKKGACIFFTASQPTEITKKPNTKPARKPSKNLSSALKASLDPSTKDAPSPELASDSEETNQPPDLKRKPSHAAAPKTGRRLIASPVSERATAADEPAPVESENSVKQKAARPSRKLAPVSYVQHSPEPAEQSSSKPPVTLAKSSRLSRSTSRATAARASNDLSNSSTTHRPRTRASSNASSHPDGIIPNQTVEDFPQPQAVKEQPPSKKEQPPSKTKNQQRPKKLIKASQVSSAAASDSEDHRLPLQASSRQNGIRNEREQSVEESISTTRKIRVPGKPKTRDSKNPVPETANPLPAHQGLWPKSPESHPNSGAETSTRIKGLPPALFPGFNPKAPQLYPNLLPIAAKSTTTSAPSKDKTSNEAQEETNEQVSQENPANLVETENLLQEYLGRQDRGPITDGWLPNPFNPSHPFPPLTAEEAKMPLSEYFAYRAKQEEEAFLEWVEEKQMKPWLEAVQNAQDLLQSLINTRQSSRKNSTKKHRKNISSASVEKENHFHNHKQTNGPSTSHHRQKKNLT